MLINNGEHYNQTHLSREPVVCSIIRAQSVEGGLSKSACYAHFKHIIGAVRMVSLLCLFKTVKRGSKNGIFNMENASRFCRTALLLSAPFHTAWLKHYMYMQCAPRHGRARFFFAYAKTKAQISCEVTAQLSGAFFSPRFHS